MNAGWPRRASGGPDGVVGQDELAELAVIVRRLGPHARVLEAGGLRHRVGVERRLEIGPLPARIRG